MSSSEKNPVKAKAIKLDTVLIDNWIDEIRMQVERPDLALQPVLTSTGTLIRIKFPFTSILVGTDSLKRSFWEKETSSLLRLRQPGKISRRVHRLWREFIGSALF